MDSKEQGVCVSSQWNSEEPQAQPYDDRGLFALPDPRRDPRKGSSVATTSERQPQKTARHTCSSDRAERPCWDAVH